MTVKVVTDSVSDIPPEVATDLGITIIPALVEFGEKAYRDGIDMTTDEFYRKLESSPVLPKTSPPSPGDFGDVYRRLSKDCDGIMSIHVASNLSATCQTARLSAKEASCPVAVVDSESASMASGLLAIIAAKAARAGASLMEIEALVTDAVPRTVTYGLFDTLEYLRRGGRLGKAQAFLGALLRVKPILAIRAGEILPIERVRRRAQGIERLFHLVTDPGPAEELAVMDSTNPEDAEFLAQRLSITFPRERIYMAKTGPVIGTYVGPRSLGVAVVWKPAG